MDLDVLYRIPKDLIWQSVKTFCPPHSIDLVIYRPCLDIYITKKTFWNATSRLKPEGIFCMECYPQNISSVIKVVEDSSYEYTVSYFISKNQAAIYVFAYSELAYRPDILNSYRIDRWEQDVPSIITNVAGNGSIIMLLGDAIMPFVPTVKRHNKYVIVAGDDDIFSEIIKTEGIREVELL